MMHFQRYRNNPVIPKTPGTFYCNHSANPDLLFFKGRYHLYFRGNSADGKDRIGVAYAEPAEFNGIDWKFYPGNPVIGAGMRDSDCDSAHALDPASVVFNGRVFLYYTAHSLDAKRGSSTGLAISDDGTGFTKVSLDPVITGIAPEAVVHDGMLYLLSSERPTGAHFEIGCYISEDGISFRKTCDNPVFKPSGIDNAFDRFSVTTVRIWNEKGWYYMTYAGCEKYPDYPGAIGLARSKNLLTWERYPENPVLTRGEPGSWDEGALWFATVEKINGTYYLWYEGGGTGLGLSSPEAREASKKAREENYGGYGGATCSQIGLATWSDDLKWSD